MPSLSHFIMCQKASHVYTSYLNPRQDRPNHHRWFTSPQNCPLFNYQQVGLGIFISGSGKFCIENVQVIEATPDLALDCPVCVWGILDRSTWLSTDEGVEFLTSGRAAEFLKEGPT